MTEVGNSFLLSFKTKSFNRLIDQKLIIPTFNQAQICCLLYNNFNKISIGKEKTGKKYLFFCFASWRKVA